VLVLVSTGAASNVSGKGVEEKVEIRSTKFETSPKFQIAENPKREAARFGHSRFGD